MSVLIINYLPAKMKHASGKCINQVDNGGKKRTKTTNCDQFCLFHVS